MKNATYVGVALSVVLVLAIVVFLNGKVSRSNISVNISESKNELRLSAHFRKEDSEMVHQYLKKALNMDDLSDMDYLEIKRYETPDHFLRFYIKSRVGYVKIVLDKTENTSGGYHRVKQTGDGLKKLLTDQ
jgi:hypothetical protein